MTANVSFYVIAILALRVKSPHSLQERNVLGNVLIVDHHVKKYYIMIFTRTVREAFQRNIRQKQNLNLICFVSFKNQNWEMYCLLQPFWPVMTIVFGIFRLGQISHTISLGSRGIEGGVRENDAYCFVLRMAHFLIFIHNGGIWKGTVDSVILHWYACGTGERNSWGK